MPLEATQQWVAVGVSWDRFNGMKQNPYKSPKEIEAPAPGRAIIWLSRLAAILLTLLAPIPPVVFVSVSVSDPDTRHVRLNHPVVFWSSAICIAVLPGLFS